MKKACVSNALHSWTCVGLPNECLAMRQNKHIKTDMHVSIRIIMKLFHWASLKYNNVLCLSLKIVFKRNGSETNDFR